MNELLNDKKFSQYLLGLTGSIALTLASYFLATKSDMKFTYIAIVIGLFAGAQLILQLYLFLHLGEEKKPRNNLSALIYTTITVFAVIAGSIWIMHNLHYNMMPQDNVEREIIENEGYKQK